MKTYTPVSTFLSLRQWTGFAGMSLPWVVAIYVWHISPSISAYYYNDGRNWFVGSLFTIGAFLCSYYGYDRVDRTMSVIAGICAFGVALFPTDEEKVVLTLVGAVHFAFAGALLLILAWFSIFQFTKSSQPNPTPNKLKRNRIYRACGYTILAALALLLVTKIAKLERTLPDLNLVFWLEALCLQAFGISWMVKGEVILKD
jgi:hypothetical protein